MLRGYFGQPGIQHLQLLRRGIDERHAHAHPVLHVNDLALGLEHALIACDEHVHVTSFAADLRNPPGDARIGVWLAQLNAGDERETRHFAVFAIRSARVYRCTGESTHELFSHRALANPRTRASTRAKTCAKACVRLAYLPRPCHLSLSRVPPKMNRRFLFACSRTQMIR